MPQDHKAAVVGYVLVANDHAGSTTEAAVGEAADRLRRHAPAEVRTCRHPDDTVAIAGDLDGRALIVCGGDGSLHTTVRELRRGGLLDSTVVGLIPLGTGNDFARTVHLPLDVRQAADALVGARPRRLDLIVVDGDEVVVNVAQAGLGAEASQTATGLKPVLRKLAYPVGAAIAGAQAGPWDVRVEVDGRPLTGDDAAPVSLVAVGNGTFVGGGAELVPGSRLDDGQLQVVVARPEVRLDRAGLALDVLRGEHPDRADVVQVRGRTVTVTGDAMRYTLDGEVGEPVAERTFTVDPSAWQLLAPPADVA